MMHVMRFVFVVRKKLKYVPSDNQKQIRIMNKDDIDKPESKFQIPIKNQP